MHSSLARLTYVAMMIAHDLREQIERIDLQILHLLQDRAKLYSDMGVDEESEDISSDTIALWIEEAGENGLDEVVVEKIAKLIILLCKRKEE